MENGPFKDGLPIKTGNFPWRTVSHNQMVRDVAPGPPQHPLHQASPRAGLYPSPAVCLRQDKHGYLSWLMGIYMDIYPLVNVYRYLLVN